MKKGTNEVFLTGKIISIMVGETATEEDAAASFVLAYDESRFETSRRPSFIRVNFFGDIAKIVASSMQKDDMVYVRGELMSRRTKDRLDISEVRAHQVHKIEVSTKI